MGHHTGSATYQCLNCRLAQRVEVRTSSAGATRARGAPRSDANTSLAMLLALKKCPRCGHFDRSVASHNRHTVRVGLTLSGSLLLITALTLFAIPSVSRLVFAITVGALALGFLALLRHLRFHYPANVESRVTLLGTAPAPANDGWF